MFKTTIEKYKELYSIPYIDLADAGESNRIIVRIASFFMLVFSIAIIILFTVKYFSDLLSHKIGFLYYIIMFLLSIYGIIASRQGKDIDRSKVYIKKTIPAYIIMYTIFADAVYTVIVGSYFNGFIVFCIVAVIAVCACSFNPLVLLSGEIISVAIMSPYLIKEFNIYSYANCIIITSLFFCLSLYKRRVEKKHIQFLKKQRQNLEARTFGNFTLIYENKVVKFTRSKSYELIAYLILKKGSSVKTKELISILWGDHADSARYGNNFRNLVVDIKHTLNDLQIQNFFVAEYNNFRINPEVIKCDYYDFLAGEPSAVKSFAGEFMNQFSWAEEAVSFLEQKALKNN